MIKTHIIETNNLSIGYEGKTLLQNINLKLEKKQVCCILGANGIGKSTLLKTLAGLVPTIAGNVLVEQKKLDTMSNLDIAKRISLVINNQTINSDITIEELVALGRSPYTSWSGWLKEEDHEVVSQALASCNLTILKQKKISQVSDGERQRAMIARCMAQRTDLILLDEPTAFLDYPNKLLLTELLKKIISEDERTVIMSTHDWEIALDVADILWVITEDGHILEGHPDKVIKMEAFQTLFSSHQLSFDPERKKFKLIL